MEQSTQIVTERHSADFDSSSSSASRVGVVWGRDLSGPPQPGAPGDVLLATEDVYSRFLRARRADGSTLIVEFQRDAVDPSGFPATWGPVTNGVMEAIWRRRGIAASAHGGVQRGDALGYEAYRPLVVCREKGVTFHAPSPVSGRLGALDDCRDEELLSSVGLPGWLGSSSRFLYDTTIRNDATPSFWTAAREVPRSPRVTVGGWDRFARDLGPLVERAAARDPIAVALTGKFPCIGCDQVPRCYPKPAATGGAPPQPPLAGKRLAPVAFHPFRAIAWREEVVDFEEHCDILGGAPWPAFRSRHLTRWTHPARRLVREALETTAFNRTEAVDPVTSLRQKLRLFESVVENVLAYHRAHGQPHLGVSPVHVVSHELFGDKVATSLRGGMRGAMIEDVMTPPPGPPIWLPPPEQVAPYAHPDIVRAAEPFATAPADGSGVHEGGFRFARNTQVRIGVGRIWEDASHGTTECELTLAGLGQANADLDTTDRIRVVVSGQGWERAALWCRVDNERLDGTGTTLRTFPAKLTSAQVLDLRAGTGKQALFGTAAVYRTHGAYYDIHSLGLLLLRALLENPKQSMAKLVGDVLPSITPFCRAVRKREGATSWDELVRIIGEVSRTAPLDVALSDANVCFIPGEVMDRGRVPPKVWAEILAVVAACVTRATEVSFCSTARLEPDRDRFCRPAEKLLAAVRLVRASLPAATTIARPAERPAERRPPPVAFDPGATIVPTAPPKKAVGPDPRDARIAELERTLASSAARIERLEADKATRIADKGRADRSVAPASPAEAAAWRNLYEAAAGASVGALAAPKSGDPAFELVKALLVDGLETLSVTLGAMAELGGQEFALEQRNLQRQVRQALLASAQGSDGADERLAEALALLRSTRSSVGGAIGMLVEAHGMATQEGCRKLLATLDIAMKQELSLRDVQEKKLTDIMTRMRSELGQLIARLYDPAFAAQVKRWVVTGGGSRNRRA